MQSGGWVAEGYGPEAVVMCAPKFATSADDVAFADPTFYFMSFGASLAAANEGAAVTHHAIALPDSTIHYTATTGHLTARDPQSGQPKASMFYVAYAADGKDPATRPVTFFFNGGPGSSSVWLHLGSFGPRRLATGMPATTAPRPFPLVDNHETLLDSSDLVFVDAVGTGLSEAITPFSNQSFWGVDADAAVFRDFVLRYIESNGRAASPKFLFGESYGTTRAAVLANLLETAGTALTGVVLQSSVLDYNTNCGVVELPIFNCAPYFPTYGSVGAYYGRVAPPPSDLAAFRNDVEIFAVHTYAPAVADYLRLGVLPPDTVFTTLAADSGIAQNLWRARFNLDPFPFQQWLIPGTLIGRYDARVFAPVGSPLAAEDDPSSTLISPSFVSAIRPYLQGPLKYSFPTTYLTLGNAIRTWNFAHDGRELPDTIPDLAAAIAQNPGLRVLSVNGYHDLATPYFLTALDLARLGASARVQFRTYEGGHMTYLDDGSRARQRVDVRSLFRAPLLAP
jgi:carboxypeptidase C (cathepsin A)